MRQEEQLQKKSTLKLDITGFVKYKLHNGYRLNLLNIEENIAQNKEIKKLRGFQHVIYKIFKVPDRGSVNPTPLGGQG